MKSLLSGLIVAGIAGWLTTDQSQAENKAKNPHLGSVRHVVLFKFKDGTSAEQVKAIEDGFRALPSKLPIIAAFEYGTDVSVENLSQGFTHCFLVTFKDTKARDTYLPHPAHQEFVKMLKPHLDKVLALDYIVRE